ncbi:MAG TPA: urease accessory protein UreE [Methylocella sp.]|nr:urease accessory protein UreE [Methylocella sp.]
MPELMRRAISVLPAGTWPAAAEAASVTLCWEDRHRRRARLSLDDGRGEILLDLREPSRLNEGDGLSLEGGGIVRVIAALEPLLEITAGSVGLPRLAYHLGNRHVPMQVWGETLLIRPDHVIEEMVKLLGAQCTKAQRAFCPEPGAYGGGHSHDHSRDSTH